MSSVFSYFTSYLTLTLVLTPLFYLWSLPPTPALTGAACAVIGWAHGCTVTFAWIHVFVCKKMCGFLKHTRFLLKLSIIVRIVYSGSTLRLLLGRWVCVWVYVWVSPMRSSNDDCGGLNVTIGRTVTKRKRHLLQQNVTSLLSLPLLCSVSCSVAAWSWRLTVFSQKSWNTVQFHSTTGMTSPLFFLPEAWRSYRKVAI